MQLSCIEDTVIVLWIIIDEQNGSESTNLTEPAVKRKQKTRLSKLTLILNPMDMTHKNVSFFFVSHFTSTSSVRCILYQSHLARYKCLAIELNLSENQMTI